MALKGDISDLVRLCSDKQSLIPYDSIPEKFKADISSFLFGQTLIANSNNEMCIHRHDFLSWLKKIYYQGFEKPIDLYVG